MQNSKLLRTRKESIFTLFIKVLLSLIITFGLTYLTVLLIGWLASFVFEKFCPVTVTYGYREAQISSSKSCSFLIPLNIFLRITMLISIIPWYFVARKLIDKLQTVIFND